MLRFVATGPSDRPPSTCGSPHHPGRIARRRGVPEACVRQDAPARVVAHDDAGDARMRRGVAKNRSGVAKIGRAVAFGP
jgi:hypothetical protein